MLRAPLLISCPLANTMFYSEDTRRSSHIRATIALRCAIRDMRAELCRIMAEDGMKTDKHDRRSERTRRLLGEALIALMLERPYAGLTVGEILERADIGRSTFYAHYWDKDDLLTSEIERMLDALTQQAASAPAASPALPPSWACSSTSPAPAPLSGAATWRRPDRRAARAAPAAPRRHRAPPARRNSACQYHAHGHLPDGRRGLAGPGRVVAGG